MIHAESLIQIKSARFGHVPECEWVFFYSKNGVKYFFEKAKMPESVGMAAMGEATAEAISQAGYDCHFIGRGTPDEIAGNFLDVAAGERVLFPRAKSSKKSIQKRLKNKIQVLDLVVYKNKMRKDVNIPRCDTLVFTSPMNFKAYLKNYDIEMDQTLIAIGPTTAKQMEKLGFGNALIAKDPTEQALVDIVLDSR